MFDAVTVYAHGLSALDRGHKLKLANLSCDSEIPWNDGLSLFNYLDSVSLTGLTGKIEFNEGKRVNFKLDLLKLKREELQKVGFWTSERGLEIKDPSAFYESNNTRITLTVMTREEKPYLMLREGNFTGNDRFEGFCIDLLKGIAQQVGFQYTIRLVPDNVSKSNQEELTCSNCAIHRCTAFTIPRQSRGMESVRFMMRCCGSRRES